MSEGREGGYIKLFRSIESSEDFVGLRPDQCWVAVRLAQLANYKPGFSRFRGQAIPVGRGELAHTLETISERTGATIKVVRTTVSHLLQTGFLGTRMGTVAGTTYRILIVRNYERYQGDEDEAGTVAGTVAGSDRARDGHETGTDRALRERREEGEEEKKETLRLAPLDAPPTAPKAKPEAKRDPLRRALSDALVAVFLVERTTPYGFDAAKDGQALSRLLSWSRDVNEHARRFRLSLREPIGDYSYRVDTIAAFATGRVWNHFAAPGSAPAGSLRKLN